MSAAVGGAELPRRARGVAGLPEWFVSRQPILLAVLVLAVVAVPQTSLVIQRLVQSEPKAGPVTLIVWGLYAVPLLALILTVDYFEHEPWWLVALALVWGGLIATGLALSANSAVQSILTTTEGLSFTTQWGAAIAGPTDEELLKGLGVVVCALLASRRMRSPVDGFILGAVVGLGFQVVEDIVYTANVMATGADPWSALWEMFLLRGIMAGLWSHAVYTGLFGLGLGYALTRPDWPRGRQVLAVVAGFAAAWTLHFLWNSPLIVDSTDWRLIVVKGLPALLLLLALLQRAQRADSAVFLPALAAFADPMVASDAEIASLADRRSRQRARSQARATGGWRGAHAERRLQRAQADLAVAVSTGDGVGAAGAREELAQERYLLGHLPQHPPVFGRIAGTWSIVLGVGGLFVPVVGVLGVVVAIVGLLRARAAAAARRGASVSARLWIGLALGVVGVVLVAVAYSRTG
ncbi:MAG TPA: PrsW family intramembrane metalloprotease [Kineosporiaceae bacterium]|nr:PrsW family intramembrane metalloprotease [Kineosporiaceae bacterium]